MHVAPQAQSCPRCLRPTVAVTFPWGEQLLHTGTWRERCGEPSRAEQASGRAGLPIPPSDPGFPADSAGGEGSPDDETADDPRTAPRPRALSK